MSGKNPSKAPSTTTVAAAASQASIKAKLKEARIASSQEPKGELKVPRGTERARRRAGLVKNWQTTKGAKQMLPVASTQNEEIVSA